MFTHKTVSMFKSALRGLAYTTIVLLSVSPIIEIVFAALLLAEILGVIEEFMPAPKIVDLWKKGGSNDNWTSRL